jgi:hypothetical protein
MRWDGAYPNSGDWADGLNYFANGATSQAALADLNKGGWTDFVFNMVYDGKGSNQSGTGKYDLWKRAGSGSWIKVMEIRPRETTRGGLTFNHGAGYRIPGDGWGCNFGQYMQSGEAGQARPNHILYFDNFKIGDENATFADMSPDGSTP